MELTYAYAADFVKSAPNEDGTLDVFGKATGPDLDLDKQICDPEWLKSAMPEWMEIGNVREMHQPIAAGVGLELESQGDDWFLKSRCVDDNTRRKIESGVLKGYSIGIRNAKVVKDAGAPGGRIVGGDIIEVSYVDRPANPTALMTVAKSVDGEWQTEEAPAVTEIEAAELAAYRQHLKHADGSGEGASSTGEEESVGAESATSDGEGPESAPTDASKAADTDPLPVAALYETWKAADAETRKSLHDPAVLASVRDGLVSMMTAELGEFSKGENEIDDIYQLLGSLSTFLNWWCDEAYEGETDSPFTDQEADDMAYISLGADADILKRASEADATDDDKVAARTEILKALGLDTLLTTSEETVKAAERIEALEAELETVKSMAAPGGPARARTQAQAAKSLDAERSKNEADRLRSIALAITDPEAKTLYLEKAAEAERLATELSRA